MEISLRRSLPSWRVSGLPLWVFSAESAPAPVLRCAIRVGRAPAPAAARNPPRARLRAPAGRRSSWPARALRRHATPSPYTPAPGRSRAPLARPCRRESCPRRPHPLPRARCVGDRAGFRTAARRIARKRSVPPAHRAEPRCPRPARGRCAPPLRIAPAPRAAAPDPLRLSRHRVAPSTMRPRCALRRRHRRWLRRLAPLAPDAARAVALRAVSRRVLPVARGLLGLRLHAGQFELRSARIQLRQDLSRFHLIAFLRVNRAQHAVSLRDHAYQSALHVHAAASDREVWRLRGIAHSTVRGRRLIARARGQREQQSRETG